MFRRPQRSAAPLAVIPGGGSVQNRLASTVPRYQREHLLAVAAQALEYGLAAGQLSEASLRVAGNKILILRREAWYGSAADADLLLAAMQPNKTLDTPELPPHIEFHRTVYSAVHSARVVLLVQPRSLMVLANRAAHGESLAAGGGEAIFWDRMEPAQLTDGAAAGGVNVVKGIGALAWGADGYEALAKLHGAERWAQIMSG